MIQKEVRQRDVNVRNDQKWSKDQNENSKWSKMSKDVNDTLSKT